MPKNKTHSGAKKRFKVTGSGKLRRLQTGRKSGAAFASAPTTGSRKKHRQKSGTVEVARADGKAAKKLLGRSPERGLSDPAQPAAVNRSETAMRACARAAYRSQSVTR